MHFLMSTLGCHTYTYIDDRSQQDGKRTGEGDKSVYKVPEYFQYNEHSYYDIDMDMLKYRLEQPHPGGKY